MAGRGLHQLVKDSPVWGWESSKLISTTDNEVFMGKKLSEVFVFLSNPLSVQSELLHVLHL